MANVTISFYNKNNSLIHQQPVINSPIPRVGEILHYEDNSDRGMTTYIISDVRHNLAGETISTVVDACAISANSDAEIDDARLRLMHGKGWVSTNLDW